MRQSKKEFELQDDEHANTTNIRIKVRNFEAIDLDAICYSVEDENLKK